MKILLGDMQKYEIQTVGYGLSDAWLLKNIHRAKSEEI